VGAVFWLTKFVVLPQLTSPWNRLGLVSTVAGVTLGGLTIALDPRRSHTPSPQLVPQRFPWPTVMAVAAVVVVLFSANLNLAGAITYAGVGLVLLGTLARQLVHHQIGWHTASPHVDSQQRQRWRTYAENPERALDCGVTDLENLALNGLGGYAVVCTGLVLLPACYLGCGWVGALTWSWWVPPLTVLVLWIYERIWVTHSRSNEIFAAAMGHWIDYQKDSAGSPLVYQSPAGSATCRTLLTWQVVGVLTVGLAALVSNSEFLNRHSAPFDRADLAIVALLDTALAAVTVPWLLWYGLKISTAPALVAAWALHESADAAETDPNPSE